VNKITLKIIKNLEKPVGSSEKNASKDAELAIEYKCISLNQDA